MKAVIDELNVAYGEKEKGGFIKLNLVSLALTGGAILALRVVNIVASSGTADGNGP
jgi:membrane protein